MRGSHCAGSERRDERHHGRSTERPVCYGRHGRRCDCWRDWRHDLFSPRPFLAGRRGQVKRARSRRPQIGAAGISNRVSIGACGGEWRVIDGRFSLLCTVQAATGCSAHVDRRFFLAGRRGQVKRARSRRPQIGAAGISNRVSIGACGGEWRVIDGRFSLLCTVQAATGCSAHVDRRFFLAGRRGHACAFAGSC